MNESFSDEYLNAYIDDQLTDGERGCLLDHLRQDQELAGRVCKLQKVRDMVQLAYHNVAAEHGRSPMARSAASRRAWPAIAASVLLLVGALGGWGIERISNHTPSLLELAQTAQTGTRVASAQDEWRLMLHVDSGDPERLQVMLDETEQLLRTSAARHQKVRVEIMTNGAGLSLMEQSNAPYTRKLRALAQQYDNLGLLACKRALDRLKEDKGIELDLVPEARVVDSAMHQVIRRQKEGWAYLRI
jgi:intracellular sulfur oxidation DsrE/DsrF family protein